MNPHEISLSNFLRRAMATSIDFMFLSPIFFAWWYMFPSSISVFWEYSSSVGSPITRVIFFQPLYALPFLGIIIAYFSLFEGWLGATPGKFLLRERVLTLQAGRITFIRAFVRNLLKPIDCAVGILIFFVSRRSQTLGDLAAGTIVIKKNTNGLPIDGADVSFGRIASAIIFAVFITVVGFFLTSLILKIKEVNRSALSILQKVKEAKSTEDLADLYQVFSPEMRDNVSLEQFVDSFHGPEFRSLLEALEVGKATFYDWEFTRQRAELLGEANDIVIELTLIKNEKGVWEPFFLWIY